MRRFKEEAFKRQIAAISIPPSFLQWVQKGPESLSRISSVAISEKILGMPVEEFEFIYMQAKNAKNRAHPQDAPKKEFKRAARWVLEGKINKGWVLANQNVILSVEWLLTQKKTLVEIDFSQEGFKKVIYDRLREDPPKEKSKNVEDLLLLLSNKRDFKHVVLTSWLKASLEGEEKK